jgi:PBSX family phage terminase large subunit
MLNEFKPHKYQQLVLDAPERFINAIAGKQSGKTMVGPVWLCAEIYKNFEKGLRGDYLITAPTNKILEQAALPKFKDVMPKDWGEWKEQRHCFELVWGDKIYVRSADEPKHIESMTLRAYWGDEAGQFKWEVHQNLMARVAIHMGRGLYTTTPYTANWLKRDVLKRAGRYNEKVVENGDKTIAVINWTSADNPYFSKEEFERLKNVLPAAIFERDYCGKFTQLTGLVFPFDDEDYVVDAFEVPTEWKRTGGLDFGSSDPTACLSIAEDSTRVPSVFYVCREFYQSNVGQLSIVANFIKEEGLTRVGADGQSKQLISELVNAFGLGQITGISGPAKDIESGCKRIYELLKTGRLKVFRNCRNLIEELGQYHYPSPNDERPTPDKPVDYFNHAIDALRYAFSLGASGKQIYTDSENRIASKKAYVRGMVQRANRNADPFTGYF